MKKFSLLFDRFQRIPKGVLVGSPDELVRTPFILNVEVLTLLNLNEPEVYFTRRSLKHLSEKKTEGMRLLEVMPDIFRYPECLNFSSKKNRWLISKSFFTFTYKKYFVVVVELVGTNNLVIVTSFIAQQKYLKNYKILWRTAT